MALINYDLCPPTMRMIAGARQNNGEIEIIGQQSGLRVFLYA